MDITALIISIVSIFFTGFFSYKFNKKLNTHDSINKVKETMSIEKYKDEKSLYKYMQEYLLNFDKVINYILFYDDDEHTYDNDIEESRDAFNYIYSFWMRNKSNMTKRISDKYEGLIEFVRKYIDKKFSGVDIDIIKNEFVPSVYNLRDEIYNEIRERLESIDIIDNS